MFKNREEAGKILGKKLLEELGPQVACKPGLNNCEIIVLGIPRGGIVIVREVAKTLNCPMDVIVVRKLGAPENPELAIGAIGETKGAQYIDKKLSGNIGADKAYLEQEIRIQLLEIKRRERIYRQARLPLGLKNKTVIIVDDGSATGATVIAAAREVWNNKPKKVIIALPVVAKDTLEKLEKEADEVIYLEAPEQFFSVSQFYSEFKQISDEEVIEILK